MDLTSKKFIKNLLKKHGVYPSKTLGQNFLISKGILEKILDAANLKSKDVVLEIGPGIGTLTKELAKKAKQVIAIEKDSKMIKILKETLRDLKNIELIQEDILKYDFKSQVPYKIVANLPYYITSPVLRKFLEIGSKPKEMILMVQKEVAQRIVASPPNMSILAISVQFFAKPEIISFVSKNCFWPQPKVDSAILKISQISMDLPPIDTDLFFKIVRAGFAQPRKQLVNSLSNELKLEKEKVRNWLKENEIKPERRPET
ncbi:unnamed protein product, partial [marine sediment metagenome]